jgi:hypothetical protein
MSLLELIVSLVIMGVVMGAAMQFFVGQSKSFRRGASDVTLLQNIRFGADLLNQHLRSVGANVVGDQPPIIYVDDHVLSFNADYATNTSGDLNAIYYTPNAPAGEVEAIRGANAITVPGQSSLVYPTGDWLASPGVMSPAEMITFWFEPDTETVRADDYVLLRQVNDAQPEAVVRNILKDTVPFFRFLYLRDSSANLSMDTVKTTDLPFDYVNTPLDSTGKNDQFKGLRAVIVSYIVTNGLTGAAERTRPMSLVAPFPNMANRQLKTCGNDPVPMTAPAVALDADGHSVDVTWPADGDETGGERDIVNYLLWRRVAGDSVWHAPFVAIPGGSPPTYNFVDSSVPQDTTGVTVNWEYAVAAQDCTPSYSDPILAAGTVAVPPAP